MNMQGLARRAGVSVSTVSKAFSGSAEISEATRRRIFEIAREEDSFDRYNKNRFGKKVIGVICPEITSDYYTTCATILQQEITAHGGIMTLSVTHFDKTCEKEFFTYYSAYCKADGIILINPHGKLRNVSRVPAVAISPAAASENVDTVQIEFMSAVTQAVDYLKHMGHKRVGFAGESLTRGKLERYLDALRQVGLPVLEPLIHISSQRYEAAGIDAVRAWLAAGNLPTAIFAAYDYIAVGVIKALREAGFRVPEDVSVIGMDDIAIAPYLETPLSSVRTFTVEVCQKTVELVMRKIENPYFSMPGGIRIGASFIPRASSGPAPQPGPGCAP